MVICIVGCSFPINCVYKHVPNTSAAYICCPENCKKWSSYPTWRRLCFNSGDFFPLRKYFMYLSFEPSCYTF